MTLETHIETEVNAMYNGIREVIDPLVKMELRHKTALLMLQHFYALTQDKDKLQHVLSLV